MRDNTDVAPTTAKFIPSVLTNTTCKKHGAKQEDPCYVVNGRNGICNARAKRAGYTHEVSEKSMKNRIGSAEARRKDR